MKKDIKTTSPIIWGIVIKDDLSFFTIGKTIKEAKQNVLIDGIITNKDVVKITNISIENAKNILIDTDGDFECFSTLFEEAVWAYNNPEFSCLVATNFDVVADFNLR